MLLCGYIPYMYNSPNKCKLLIINSICLTCLTVEQLNSPISKFLLYCDPRHSTKDFPAELTDRQKLSSSVYSKLTLYKRSWMGFAYRQNPVVYFSNNQYNNIITIKLPHRFHFQVRTYFSFQNILK